MLEKVMSLVQKLTDKLGIAIVSGEFLPGAVLPNEASLSSSGGIGRGSVREAVRMLQAKGMIESRPKRGTTVLPPRNWQMYDSEVQTWMRASTPNQALLVDLVEIRSAAEPMAAALAARRGKPEDLAIVERALRRMEEALRGRGDPYDADLAFHVAILEASGNRFLAGLAPLIGTSLLFSFRITNAARGDRVGDLAAHARVAEAIRNRNEKQAENAMFALLLDVKRTIAALELPASLGPSIEGRKE